MPDRTVNISDLVRNFRGHIREDNDAIFQAKRFAWNSPIPFAIPTHFERLRLYDTTLKPIFNDPRRAARFGYDSSMPSRSDAS